VDVSYLPTQKNSPGGFFSQGVLNHVIYLLEGFSSPILKRDFLLSKGFSSSKEGFFS